MAFAALHHPVRQQWLAIQGGLTRRAGHGEGTVLNKAHLERKQRNFDGGCAFGVAQQQVANRQRQVVHRTAGAHAVTQAAGATGVLHGGEGGR